MSTAEWDGLTEEQLRANGSLKWTAHEHAIGAWVAEMDYPLATPIRRALRDYAESELFGYPPPALDAQLAAAASDYYGRNFGWTPDPDFIAPIADVLAGLGAVLDIFLEPQAAVVVPTPAYMPFLTYPALKNRRIIQVPMLRGDSGWQMDLSGIREALQNGGGLVLLCNPHNPIGKVYTRQELQSLSEVVQEQGARVFSDEIHSSLVFEGAHVPYASLSPETAAHAITATSATKAFNMPGLKCAQMVFSNPADLDLWRDKGFFIGHGASTPGKLATIAAYNSGEPWRQQVLGYLRDNRDLLTELLEEHLPGVFWLPPEGTYLGWLDARALGHGERTAEFFLSQARVALVEGAQCGAGSEGFVRMNFALPRPILVEAIKRMGQAASKADGL